MLPSEESGGRGAFVKPFLRRWAAVIPRRQMKYRSSISLLCHCWIKSRKWLNYLSATCTGGWSGQLAELRGGGGCRIESRGIKVKLYGGVDTGGNMRGRVRVGLGEGLNTSVGVSRSNTTTHTSLLPRFGNVTQTSRP